MINYKMICLGIESTAHTIGVGIVSDEGKILANEKYVFTTDSGGLKPGKIVEHHVLMYDFILQKAIEKSNIKLKDISLIAFSQGPGLGGCLRVGAAAARRDRKAHV